MLTNGQRMQIRLYLGWSERFHQTDSQLEQAMNALDSSQSTDAEALILTVIMALIDIDTRLVDALRRLKATQVASITLPGPMEIAMLRSEGRRLVGRIASLLGVEVRHDVFSGSGPMARAGVHGMYQVGGGMPPLG